MTKSKQSKRSRSGEEHHVLLVDRWLRANREAARCMKSSKETRGGHGRRTAEGIRRTRKHTTHRAPDMLLRTLATQTKPHRFEAEATHTHH